MKAMILAAGLGTRLRPLTLDKPKPLVEFLGVPMLERIINKLTDSGTDRIIVNIHHFAEQVIAFMESKNYFNHRVVLSDERDRLMDTGGGLLKARELLKDDQPFILYNVDVHTGIDLAGLYRYHCDRGALITIAVTDRPTSRSLLFDREGYLTGWQHNQTGERKIVRNYSGQLRTFANSCVHIISQELFALNKLSGLVSLTDMYLELAREHKITYYIHNEDYWYNLGLYESFIQAEGELSTGTIQ
jgi:NDP-sugar pyrophosphorylase family protein